MIDPLILQAEMNNFRQRIDMLEAQLLKSATPKPSLTKENDSARGNQGTDNSAHKTLQEENRKLRKVVQYLYCQIQSLGLQANLAPSLREFLPMMGRTPGTQRRTLRKKREIFNSQRMRLRHLGMQEAMGQSRRKLNNSWRTMSQSLRQRISLTRQNKVRQITTWGMLPQ